MRLPYRSIIAAAGLAMPVGCVLAGGGRLMTPSTLSLGEPPLGLDIHVPVPEENSFTRAKAALGERLFFDRRLSGDGTRSCASCHRPDVAFADDVPVSPGASGRLGVRNAPSILNVAYARHFGWDGRSATLEEQVLMPIANPVELASDVEAVVARLRRNRSYRAAFQSAFGDGPSRERLGFALATYVRTLRAGDAPFDRFRAGDTSALSPDARRGFELFVGKARCATCHVGPMLSDQRFHNTGVAWRRGRLTDAGRGAITGARGDSGAFRTPSLRNAERTAPYMHDGSVATLADVVGFYERGGVPNPYLSPELRPLRLTEDERRNLVAFLQALTSPH